MTTLEKTDAKISSHHGLAEPQKASAPEPSLVNAPAPDVSFFTPLQSPPAGTTLSPEPPKLFQPLTLRGLTFQNRIILSPLCQYSADNGHFTPWHLAHLGGIITRGPGLSFIEATAVTPQGRITPEDSGLWTDSQMAPLRSVVEFAHSQGQKIGIQLAHAGRKASTVAPWLSSGAVAGEDVGGWPEDVWAPSAVPWSEMHAPVKALSLADIEGIKRAWAEAVQRAVKVGFDVVEIHAAHGYLLHEFNSPVSNKRTDAYGGSWENRTRLAREILEITRNNVPDSMPVFLRISGSDFLEEEAEIDSWRVEDTVRLAGVLAELGLDFLDVSGGGSHPKQHTSYTGPGYQAPLAKAVKAELGDKLAVGTVGVINEGKLANRLLEEGLDAVFCGRGFQKNPGLVWSFAEELGVEIQMANQIRWGFTGRGKKR